MSRTALRACAAAVMLLPSALVAQTETRVAAHAGMLPFTALHAAAQVEVTPGGGGLSYFAEYNRWAWGMVCVEEVGGAGRGCPQTGHSLHAGVTRRLGRVGARWRPYLSGAAGAARVLDLNEERRPVQLSLGVEGGYDVGGAGPFALRLGARWQARPQVGTDYFGPVVGFRLRL